MPPAETRPAFSGWRMVRIASAVQFIQSGLLINVFSDYADVLRDRFGFDRTEISIAFAMTRAESGLLGPLQGWMVDRVGPRKVMVSGALLFGAGWLAFSQISNLATFYSSYILISIGASLCGFLTLTTVLVHWFRARRATALSLSQAGFALGGLMVPAVAWYLGRYGFSNAAVITGFIGIVTLVPLSLMIVHRPSDVGQEVDGGVKGPTRHRVHVTEVDFTAKEALRTKAFWYISLGHGSALLVVAAVLAHRAIYLTDDRGWTNVQAGLVGGGLVIMQFVGQLLGGFLGDRIDKRYIAAAAMFGHTAGLLMFAHASRAWMVWAFVPLHGVAWGARGPLMQALRADYFGPTSFGTIMGFSSLVVMFGMMGGGLIAGAMADAFGSYTPGFTLLALVSSLGAVFFLALKPPAPPQREVPVAAEVPSEESSAPVA